MKTLLRIAFASVSLSIAAARDIEIVKAKNAKTVNALNQDVVHTLDTVKLSKISFHHTPASEVLSWLELQVFEQYQKLYHDRHITEFKFAFDMNTVSDDMPPEYAHKRNVRLEAPIDIELSNVSLHEALDRVVADGGLLYRVQDGMIIFRVEAYE